MLECLLGVVLTYYEVSSYSKVRRAVLGGVILAEAEAGEGREEYSES